MKGYWRVWKRREERGSGGDEAGKEGKGDNPVYLILNTLLTREKGREVRD